MCACKCVCVSVCVCVMERYVHQGVHGPAVQMDLADEARSTCAAQINKQQVA